MLPPGKPAVSAHAAPIAHRARPPVRGDVSVARLSFFGAGCRQPGAGRRASAEKSGERQKSMSSRSSASTRHVAAASAPAISNGIESTPCWSPWSRSPGRTDQPTDGHRLPDAHEVVVGVRDGNPPGEGLEPDGPHLGQVADGAVRDHGDAPQCGEDRPVHLTPVGAHTRWIIEVLDDHEPGLRQLEDVLPEGRRRHPIPFGGTPHRGRRGVADPGAEVGEHAPHRPIGKPLVAGADVEGLDAVGQRRRGERPQLVENRAVELPAEPRVGIEPTTYALRVRCSTD